MMAQDGTHAQHGRLSILAAAWVIARRDFTAVLFSRTFFFFLLGPLFPLIVGGVAGGLSQDLREPKKTPAIGIAMQSADADSLMNARRFLHKNVDGLPELIVLQNLEAGEKVDPKQLVERHQSKVVAVLTGTPQYPVLTGSSGAVSRWENRVGMIVGQVVMNPSLKIAWPELRTQVIQSDKIVSSDRERLQTAQLVQTVLFLLTMMLAGMVLSNLVEEKSNKIIEVLAAAIPMEAVFLGKLFAMSAVSLVGIAAWGAVGWLVVGPAGLDITDMPAPAVGWPMLIALMVLYFAMAYLLLGAVFLAIGSLASTVREVQTLSMPVTMMQLVLFFFSTYAMSRSGSTVELIAMIFPFSSPFTMAARAVQDAALLPHFLALVWQAVCVLLLVRLGSLIFRKRVMRSGGQGWLKRWWQRKRAA